MTGVDIAEAIHQNALVGMKLPAKDHEPFDTSVTVPAFPITGLDVVLQPTVAVLLTF